MVPGPEKNSEVCERPTLIHLVFDEARYEHGLFRFGPGIHHSWPLAPGALGEKTLGVFVKLNSSPFISKFTLVGGTALAIQLGHRVSEDLDFIFDGEQLNVASIRRNIIKLFPGSSLPGPIRNPFGEVDLIY